MTMLQGCSELQETARLVGELLQVRGGSRSKVAPVGAVTAPAPPPPLPPRQPEGGHGLAPLPYRGDRLEFILASLCQRGGLTGAVVADSKGLPLADYNSPVGGETLAAFTSVLGVALERAGMLLGAQGADLISLDMNYTEKVVLRRFALGEEPYYLLVICSQDIDERSEVELSIEQITAVLSDG